MEVEVLMGVEGDPMEVVEMVDIAHIPGREIGMGGYLSSDC